MPPPRPRTLSVTGDNSGLKGKLAKVAARPSRIITMAPRLCESMTTMTTTANTSVSPTARAVGSPCAASGVTHNRAYDLSAVTGAAQGNAGVLHGRLLVEFAEAVLCENEEVLAHARAALAQLSQLGDLTAFKPAETAGFGQKVSTTRG